MALGRIPGPYGRERTFGCILFPQSLGRRDFYSRFPHITPGPTGTHGDLGAIVVEPVAKAEAVAKEVTVVKEDENELKLLREVYGVVKNTKARTYVYRDRKRKWHYRVKEYVKDRDAFFGSAEAYKTYLDKAREELDADKSKLRRLIEPNKKVRKKRPNWKKAQDVFYSWVRKAYENKLGEKVDIPKLIKAGMSEKLQKALKRVRVDFGKEFKRGGFNPRPMKLAGYRLGTLSDHAIGTAADIESAKNAHIKTKVWNNILKYTGKSLSHATRKSQWKSKPKELHKSIKEINDEFVSKLDKAVKEAEEAIKKAEKAKAASELPKPAGAKVKRGKKKAKKPTPLEVAIAKDATLRSIGAGFLKRWRKGFFSLPWSLVKEFHEEGFLWGGTFSHPDLHHFQL